MAVDVFKARLAAQTDLIRKPDFDSISWVKVSLKEMMEH